MYIFDLTRQLCEIPCQSDADCHGGAQGAHCFDNFCLGAASHEECPDPNAAKGCACSSSSTSEAFTSVAALGVALVVRKRRRT